MATYSRRKAHGHMSVVGYSLSDFKELDMTQKLNNCSSISVTRFWVLYFIFPLTPCLIISIVHILILMCTFLVAQLVKNLPAIRRPRFNPRVRKIAWRRKWQPTPVLLPGEFHGQRIETDYNPWNCRVRHDCVTFTFFSYVYLFKYLHQ